MRQLTEQVIVAFESGDYETVLSALGPALLPTYFWDDSEPLPSEAERLETTLSLALINIAEVRTGRNRTASSVMDIPYWEVQPHDARAILNLGLSFGLPDHFEDVASEQTLKIIASTRAGRALLFETALQLTAEKNLVEVKRLRPYLSQLDQLTTTGLLALYGNDGAEGSQQSPPNLYGLQHPVVSQVRAELTRRTVLVSVLKGSITADGVGSSAPGSRVKQQHLALILALLADGKRSKFEIREAVMPDLDVGMVAQVVMKLRSLLGKDAIFTDKEGCYDLGLGIRVETDLELLLCAAPLERLRILAATDLNGLEHVPFVQSELQSMVRSALAAVLDVELADASDFITVLSDQILLPSADLDRLEHRLRDLEFRLN